MAKRKGLKAPVLHLLVGSVSVLATRLYVLLTPLQAGLRHVRVHTVHAVLPTLVADQK